MPLEKTLIWDAPWLAGGIGDRLLGLVGLFCIAKRLKRDFLVRWSTKDLSSVIPISDKYNWYKNQVPYIEIPLNNLEAPIYFAEKDTMSWPYPHVMLWSNQNLYLPFCQRYNIPREEYRKDMLDTFSSLFFEVFHPIPQIYSNIPPYLENAVGIHIRTHDDQFESEGSKMKQVPYIGDILTRCKEHIDKEGVSKTVFLASDCPLSEVLARKIFVGYTVLTTKGSILHCGSEQELKKDGLVRVFSDLFSLSKCRVLYLGWNTNYSRVGYLLGNSDRKAYTFEHPDHKGQIYDCPLDTWLDYFSIGGRWTPR